MREVLVWSSAVDIFEKPPEVILGETGLVGDLVEIDVGCEFFVNEELGPHRTEVEVLSRILVHWHEC